MNVKVHRYKLVSVTYPSLQEHTKFPGTIVYFFAPNKGIVLCTNDTFSYPVGSYVLNTTMNLFTPFNGYVVLENKK